MQRVTGLEAGKGRRENTLSLPPLSYPLLGQIQSCPVAVLALGHHSNKGIMLAAVRAGIRALSCHVLYVDSLT